MSDSLEYVTTGAVLECSEAAARAKFIVTENIKVKISHVLVGTAMDNKPMINIPDFVMCRKTGSKCIPAPLMWEDTYPVKVNASKTLLVKSKCKCLSADGEITFLTSGQIPLPADAEAEFNEQRSAAAKELKEEEDSIGEPGFWEGMIPLWGSGRSLIHDVQTGHWGWAAADLGFLIWDVVDIAAFIVTIPAGGIGGEALTALEASAKAAMKGGRQVLKQTTKLLTKEALHAAFKKIPKLCVTACFTEGTPVYMKDGLKNIEDIRTGDFVRSYNEATGKEEYKPVTLTGSRPADVLVKITAGAETITTTPEHPFMLADSTWKLGGDLEEGDVLQAANGHTYTITQTVHELEEATVYNLEVADNHTYFAGSLAWLVHNGVCLRMLAEQGVKWAADILRGLAFNSKINKEMVELAEKYGVEYISELGVKSGKKTIRADGYIAGKAIIERKATDLAKIADETAKSYIRQAANYEEKVIANAAKGTGKTSGRVFLQVESKAGMSDVVKQYAAEKGVTIVESSEEIFKAIGF